MTLAIDIISDVVCPWCFVGKRRMEAALELYRERNPEAAEPKITWHPFQLNPNMPPEGVDRDEYVRRKFGAERAGQVYGRITAVGMEVGIPFDFAKVTRQPNTLAAHSLIALAIDAGKQDAVVEAFFRAFFLEGRDLTSAKTLAEVAVGAGLDAGDVKAFLGSADARAHIEAEDKQAREIGVEGVPFFIFNRRLAVSGAQAPEVLLEAASRGRYSTDASIYQIDPVGVVVPRTERDVQIALQIAVEEGIPVLPRGAGSSQCGQAVGAALVIDTSKYLNRIVLVDREGASAVVQPGVVLDTLNAYLRSHALWFPVDVSTSAQATIGGMAGNNSCGSRSIRYGNMVHNVLGIDALLADGSEFHFGAVPEDFSLLAGPAGYLGLAQKIRAIAEREAGEIEARWPKVLRRVQGYNLDMVAPRGAWNFAQLLVGSEGTLAFSKRIHLKLSPLPKARTLGVCHFATFRRAMEAPQHIVKLAPTAVELVDRTMIGLARGNTAFRATVEQFIRGDPDAILLVEFAGEGRDEQSRKLKELTELMADLGHPGSVVEITDAGLQREVWEVRRAGLNIMMSMKGDGKPVSFIEDCAVPLENLAEYTDLLTQVFRKHGTEGTWYAHASVGTLHVRPILNMKEDGVKKMRAIAQEACALVKKYKGAAYSGEHGDGLVRSEWIEPILGTRLASALAEIKSLFDPKGLMNPGKIVRPSRQDDRSLFRFKPGYAPQKLDTALDWSEWSVPGAASRGFAAAVEMCNNNGHCRKFDAGTMCPSFRATGG